MFGNKRLAKRSIIGTRVSALWSQDGRFYPAIIQSQVSEETITSRAVYAVRFDDGSTQHVKSRNVIGPGFQSVTAASLNRGQKVFLTLNGREVCGTVSCHDRDLDEVLVNVKTPNGEEFTTARRQEDVRLLESRKSARLESQPNTDYSKLADLQLTEFGRRRVPSHVIDVPSTSQDKNDRFRRQRHTSGDRTDSEYGDFDEVEMMDETIAAMVLTSLSVSPKSPTMPTSFINKEVSGDPHTPYPDSHLSSSVASSGFYSGHSERDDHSPPLAPLSESAPACVGFPNPPHSDDDSSGSSGRLLICEEENAVSFRCTWRGCDHTSCTSDAMERHIRRAHFDRDSDLEMTDNEEEFHYTEVDVSSQSISTMTRSFAAMNTSSPQEHTTFGPRQRHISADNVSSDNAGGMAIKDTGHGMRGDGGVFDHDYQRKMSKHSQSSSNVSSESQGQGQASSLPISISQGQIQKSLSWQIHSSSPGALVSPTGRHSKLTPQERLFQHQAQSPKSNVAPTTVKVTQHRRPRSEVRKCRKVYGMEHRDQWCTQCKWKKACTRFID
ncbi:zinc finger protein 704 [Aplysia californica]|uniref:Zinc finger protein 704 n=1 Tax=Aplysia californica TaxID=6500 RepID=A0ABM0JWK9_APLCA|nr:zinc finger protein 704 [Aplysia californica]